MERFPSVLLDLLNSLLVVNSDDSVKGFVQTLKVSRWICWCKFNRCQQQDGTMWPSFVGHLWHYIIYIHIIISLSVKQVISHTKQEICTLTWHTHTHTYAPVNGHSPSEPDDLVALLILTA